MTEILKERASTGCKVLRTEIMEGSFLAEEPRKSYI